MCVSKTTKLCFTTPISQMRIRKYILVTCLFCTEHVLGIFSFEYISMDILKGFEMLDVTCTPQVTEEIKTVLGYPEITVNRTY